MQGETIGPRLRERSARIREWAQKVGIGIPAREWLHDADLHDRSGAEIARLTRELEEAREQQTMVDDLTRALDEAWERERELRGRAFAVVDDPRTNLVAREIDAGGVALIPLHARMQSLRRFLAATQPQEVGE